MHESVNICIRSNRHIGFFDRAVRHDGCLHVGCCIARWFLALVDLKHAVRVMANNKEERISFLIVGNMRKGEMSTHAMETKKQMDIAFPSSPIKKSTLRHCVSTSAIIFTFFQMPCKSRITSLGRPLLTWAIIGSWHEPIECSQRLQAHTCCCPKVIVTQICSHVASAKVYIIINFHFEPFKTLLMHLLGDKKSPICLHAVNTCGPKMFRWRKMLNSAILALYSAISIPKQMNEFFTGTSTCR